MHRRAIIRLGKPLLGDITMNIAVLCNSDMLASPSIHTLKERGWLVGVGIPERSKARLHGHLLHIGIQEKDITCIPTHHRKAALQDWVCEIKATTVFVFGFPWKIPVPVLQIPPKGFFNFHFGELPKYRGADPIFWQLRNSEQQWGVAVHRMTAAVDQGPVVWQEKHPIIPGETYGMLCQRMGLMVADGIGSFAERLIADKLVEVPQRTEKALYSQKPDGSNLSINWEHQSADEIEWLINAANPKYGGASTLLRNREIRLVEVAPADMVAVQYHTIPGTIVHADALYGLVVACTEGKFLKVNVLQLPEGYLSGSKLFGMGVKAGDKFVTNV